MIRSSIAGMAVSTQRAWSILLAKLTGPAEADSGQAEQPAMLPGRAGLVPATHPDYPGPLPTLARGVRGPPHGAELRHDGSDLDQAEVASSYRALLSRLAMAFEIGCPVSISTNRNCPQGLISKNTRSPVQVSMKSIAP